MSAEATAWEQIQADKEAFHNKLMDLAILVVEREEPEREKPKLPFMRRVLHAAQVVRS